MPVRRERLLLLLCLIVAAGMFLPGIKWGLPSRVGDAYFFGARTPWTGAQIQAATLKRADDADRGADVDANPRGQFGQPIRINPETRPDAAAIEADVGLSVLQSIQNSWLGRFCRPLDLLTMPDLTARAEIVRRYRLFSHQPDEMITFMAFRKMRPGELNLDPHLYQYGGLWIYPVALCLKVAAAVRLVELRGGDATTYY